MKKVILGSMIITALMLAGCNEVQEHIQEKTPSVTEELSEPITFMTYDTEDHKIIEYGNIAFDYKPYHITSYMENENSIIIECERDKGESWPEKTYITINIQEIDLVGNLTMEKAVMYCKETYPDYETIKVYNNIKIVIIEFNSRIKALKS